MISEMVLLRTIRWVLDFSLKKVWWSEESAKLHRWSLYSGLPVGEAVSVSSTVGIYITMRTQIFQGSLEGGWK